MRQAPILILDEATAALDSKAETEVQEAIDRLEEGRTVICVGHQLSTLRGMDRIIVLEAGRVEEKGTYNELLERNGAFAAIASKLLWQNTIVTAKTIAKMPKLPE